MSCLLSSKYLLFLTLDFHSLRVEFEPNEDARANYSRGFAAVEILVVGAEVELVWDLPMTLPPIVFPSLIPEEYFCAKTVNEEVTGLFCYRSVNKNGCSAKEIRIGNNDVIDIDGLNKLAIEQQAYDKKASKPGHSTDSTELSTGASTEHLSSFQSPYPNKNTKQNCLPEQIEPLTAGKHSLFVDFYPDNTLRYRVSSISTEIQINKGIIPLEWPKPPVIHAGDELDETVLNCGNALNLPGRYVYTPSFGATFTVGEKILSVLFEPEDSSNWNCAKTSIKLRVMPKKVPLIYWSQPYPLIHPEPLSKLQLSANTSGFLPGSMEYLPTFGTVRSIHSASTSKFHPLN